ncbi:MAG TPA: hypothetical protein VF546_23185 [Pyrinomonadaceae bacterium]|jgi:hypothetical protein
MALKQAALRQPASQEQPGAENPRGNKLEEDASGKPEGANSEAGQTVPPDVSAVIDDLVLRHKIRTLIEEAVVERKPKPSLIQSLSTNPSVVVVLGFILSGLVGGLLTNYYTAKQQDLDYRRNLQQQELARQRSFSDELNKTRIQKIGEVWEQVDKNGVAIDRVLETPNNSSVSDEQKAQNVDTINNLFQEDRLIINKNRFWLGEQNYTGLKEHLEKNVQLALNILLARPGTDLTELVEQREQTKQDILQIRKSMLREGEPAR